MPQADPAVRCAAPRGPVLGTPFPQPPPSSYQRYQEQRQRQGRGWGQGGKTSRTTHLLPLPPGHKKRGWPFSSRPKVPGPPPEPLREPLLTDRSLETKPGLLGRGCELESLNTLVSQLGAPSLCPCADWAAGRMESRAQPHSDETWQRGRGGGSPAGPSWLLKSILGTQVP